MENEEVKENYIICPVCGYKNPSTAKFCLNCGSRLVTVKTAKNGKLALIILNFLSLIGLADMFLNSGVIKAILANSILALLDLLWLTGVAMMFYIGFKYRNRDFYLISRDFKIVYISVVFQFISYLIFYSIFLLIGLVVISPLWILYAYFLRYLYKAYHSAE